MADILTPVLTDNWGADRSWTLKAYEDQGGYAALKTALAMPQDDIIEAVKASNLRGRGGAGFPTGMKWGFIPQDNPNPKYLVVNADESEPGTCKDIPLMMASPHTLVEGVIISSYAIRANHAFIYVRGEVLHVVRRLQRAVQEAYLAGHLGKDIHGSGYDLDLVVHAGAGAYICGEETALLDSLEGRRGQPRLRPPFPAVAGLYASPTVINNVESIASVPSIIAQRRRVVRLDGHREVQGLRDLLALGPRHQPRPVRGAARHHPAPADRARGRHARGPRAEVLDPWRLEHPAAHRPSTSTSPSTSRASARPARCSARARCRSSTRPPASSGPCCAGRSSTSTSRAASARPCREGTWWLAQTLANLEQGKGAEDDLDLLLDLCDNILGRSFCALGDGATSPISSSIQYFRDEYLAHLTHGGCPFDREASTIFSPVGASA